MKTPNQPLISCCLIVRNERQRLQACLASVQELVDQWVIVDTGSTDGTPDYLRVSLSNLTLIEAPWTEHFAEARNLSLQAAEGQWILVLDADERLPASTVRQLKRLLSQPLTGIDALTLLREDQDQGQTYAWNMMTRVFRNQPDLCFVGRIHERPALKSARPLRLRLCSELRILHAVELSGTAYEHKQANYTRLLARARQEEPSPFLDFHWAILPASQKEPIAERIQILEDALIETLAAEAQANWQRPSPAWEGVPIEATILELQHLWIESDQEAHLLEQMPQFDPRYLLAESWGNWAIAAQKQGQARLAEKLFWQSLNALISDPQQGWNSWRPLAFLARLVDNPSDQVSIGIEAFLSHPSPIFAADLKHLLDLCLSQQASQPAQPDQPDQSVSSIEVLPFLLWQQAQSVLQATRTSRFTDTEATEILQVAARLLPIYLDLQLLALAVEAALALCATPLVHLLGKLAQEIWPQNALYSRLLRLPAGPQLPPALLPILARLQHCFQPGSFQQPYHLVGPTLPFLPAPAPPNQSHWHVTVKGTPSPLPLALQAQILSWLYRPASRLDCLSWSYGEFQIELVASAARQSPWRAQIHQLNLTGLIEL